MLTKSFAKVNLRLKVLGINSNNYHLLQMVNTKINFFDILKFKKTKNKEINIYMEEVNKEENLVYKVTKYMFDKYNLPGGINIDIKKRIMIGAGLAGGSANAASTIHAIDKMYKLNLNISKKREIAALFGTDIIYCLENSPALVEGIGEQITKIDIKRNHILVINPNIKISTKEIFSLYDELNKYSKPLKKEEIEKLNIYDLLENDLEEVVFNKYPEVKTLKEELLKYSNNVLMSGSGSTLYVIDNLQNLKKIKKEIKNKYPEYIYVLTKTR